jgi:hypothetical protein
MYNYNAVSGEASHSNRSCFACSDPSDLVKHLGPFISSVTNCICVYSDIKLIQVGEKGVLE